MDYFIDEETGNYISGINTHRIEKKHKIIFIKKYDSKQFGITINCPKCGNSLNTNISGICSYCKNVIDMYEYDYIISEISI